MLVRSTLATAIVLSSLPPAARSQDAPQGWSFTLGAGVVYAPGYVGSDNYQASAFPSIKVKYADRLFASVQDGVGYNLINRGGWRVGPMARYDFGRSEDEGSPFKIGGDESGDLRGLGDVDGALELGAFIEYSHQKITAKAELRQGVNGHEGLVGDAEVKYSGKITGFGPPLFFSIGPRLEYSGSNFAQAYFGIDAGQSARSGLARYEAGSGLVSYGIGGALIVPMIDNLSMVFFAGYDRLAGDAADSPLVRTRGSENQAAVGVSVGYEF
jgi:MipA family protein